MTFYFLERISSYFNSILHFFGSLYDLSDLQVKEYPLINIGVLSSISNLITLSKTQQKLYKSFLIILNKY